MILSLFRHLLSSHLRGVWCGFPGSLETDISTRCPSKEITLLVGYTDDSVVESRMNMSHTIAYVFTFFPFSSTLLSFCHVRIPSFG
jgi:hypothetical protein